MTNEERLVADGKAQLARVQKIVNDFDPKLFDRQRLLSFLDMAYTAGIAVGTGETGKIARDLIKAQVARAAGGGE